MDVSPEDKYRYGDTVIQNMMLFRIVKIISWMDEFDTQLKF